MIQTLFHTGSGRKIHTLIALLLYSGILTCAFATPPLLEVYKKGPSHYLRINRSLLHRDIFITTRVVDLSGHKNIAAGQTFHPGKIVHFVHKNDKLLLEERDYSFRSEASPQVTEALQNNQTPRYPYTLPVHQSDSVFLTIEITKFFGEEIQGISPLAAGLVSGKFESTLSGIYHFDNHPNRVNIQSELIYTGGNKPFSVRLNYNLLVMDEPASPRKQDPRVGYMTCNYRKLHDNQPIERLKYITRWKIEPRDPVAYAQGELTEPIRPIIFYIDPALPAQVVPYAKAGILDWNKAFEAIGFTNVIQVKEFPAGQAFNRHDITVNMLRYIPESRENAMGATTVDPRSGEILQADIYWYHDVIGLLRKWRFIQTAATDPAARREELPQEALGEMIRYVTAHEMGHVLGLKHNMRGSFAYPVDSLRSATFTAVHGTTASIMDYARFNYVAQPGDLEKGVKLLPPLLGPYDYMAIEWGYQPVPGNQREEEFLNRIIADKLPDPAFLFAKESKQLIPGDPAAQSNILGNDVIASSRYGIRNLQFIMTHLHEWSAGWSNPTDILAERYQLILKQLFLYLYNSSSYIGGTFYLESGPTGSGGGYTSISSQKETEALEFVLEELLRSSSWLIREELTTMLGNLQEALLKEQATFLKNLLTTIPQRFVLNAKGDPGLLFKAITTHLFASRTASTPYIEALRVTYLRQLGELAASPAQKEAVDLLIGTAAQNELNRILSQKKHKRYSSLIREQ